MPPSKAMFPIGSVAGSIDRVAVYVPEREHLATPWS
jgi:hypothetical protein